MAEKKVSKEQKASTNGKRSKLGGKRVWMPVLALLFLVAAWLLISSGVQTASTASAPTPNAAQAAQSAQGAQNAVYASSDNHARIPAKTPTVSLPASVDVAGGNGQTQGGNGAAEGECALFKNRFTSEFKCIGCVAGASAANVLRRS